ncbi:MAG: asparagine synthase (glutamine-hydrolyzing) [Burkholderiales bacterium]|nr:asparagine synthase (glutamine-hydrolyzing) [Burkholderiales bacterium]
MLQLAPATQALSAIVERMAGAIRHRGPDDAGTFVSAPVAMGFRRLSILDMSPLGHQPMASDDGSVVLVFNGEIYNYLELRSELQALGHTFKSTGDTEVLLRAYLQWGRECVERLNGMWAFVVYDRRIGRLFGSRDRFGIKPLYRYATAGHVLLASEIKAIRASGLYRGSTNWAVAGEYLIRARLDATHESFYEGIEQVRPASCFELDLEGKLQETTYWSLDGASQEAVGDPAAAFADLFEDAMRLHMRSDVPVGVHLSGGLDSTTIACSAARVRKATRADGPLVAFCYQAPEFDERELIAATVQQTGAKMFELETSARAVWDDLDEVLQAQDEPVHSLTAVIGYQLMRLTAGQGLKVILNGQGADETLAGYPSYFRHYWNTLLLEGRLGEAWREIGAYVAVHGGDRARILLRQLRYLVQMELRRVERYRALAQRNEHARLCADEWFSPELSRHLPVSIGRGGRGDLHGAMAWSMRRDPLPLYLRVEDRNSMAHSVEARVPFLDHRLVTLAHGLPANWKMRGGWNKYLLRESMRNRIPEPVRSRAVKFGFPVPMHQWLSGPLHQALTDQLTSREARERGIYDMNRVLRDLERFRRGEIDVAMKLFRVAQFEAWAALAGEPSRVAARPAAMEDIRMAGAL